MDDHLRILFLSSLVFTQLIIFLMERKNKKNNIEFINIEVIDSQAQWVHDNKIYYADVVNGKIDNKTTRKIEM